MEELSLKKYLELCLQFEDDPTEDNQNLIFDFLDKLVIRDYMSLTEKSIHAIEITRGVLNPDLDAPGAANLFEVYTLFFGLCSYAVNLDVDIGVLISTTAAYDKCYEHGLVDEILSICSEDYGRFVDYCHNMINIHNITNLIQTASLISNTAFDEWSKEMRDLKATFTPELIHSLTSYGINATTHMKDVSDILANKAIQGLNSEIDGEDRKLKRITEDLLSHVDDASLHDNNSEYDDSDDDEIEESEDHADA